MIERACDGERAFDVIVVHMEITIRTLRKHGVEVVSATQPTNDDPSSELMRKMIGIFDEHTSAEISKNTRAAMIQSAEQGFWNGSTPPLGYTIVEAERRGQKIKKKLAIDPVEAELVRLIFKVYLKGHAGSGPLGVKEETKWLNANGYRTRRGALFGVGKRLYRLVEDGLTETDEVLSDRLNALKATRDQAKAALERAKEQASPHIEIDPALIERFGRVMRENVTSGSIPFRKAYLQSLVNIIEVDDTQIRIKGSKELLEKAVLASKHGQNQCSQMSTKWRARRDSNS